MVKNPKQKDLGYEITTVNGVSTISCKTCDNSSNIPNDVKFKWCSVCKKFHDNIFIRRLLDLKTSAYSSVDNDFAIENCLRILEAHSIPKEVIKQVSLLKSTMRT